MHAFHIIQGFLSERCSGMHAKRRDCLSRVVEAALRQGLNLINISKGLATATSLRHRIKCCDRLLSNPRLFAERCTIYRGLAAQAIGTSRRVQIIVDWSELLPDGSLQLLRAAMVVKGRAFVIYEEVHPQKQLGALAVHRNFMRTLRQILPAGCAPVILTDAGFRATWFHMLDQQGWAWVGRIRNRDMVRRSGDTTWAGSKTWYAKACAKAQLLGRFHYARSNPVPCQLVLVKHKTKGRHHKTKLGKPCHSRSSKKNRLAQREPWLLAVSPRLAALSAAQVVQLYAGRMQIEQTFRDLKNHKWGMGLENSQTRVLKRMSILILIGALLSYALWLIGLAMRQAGQDVGYGSRRKAANTLSVLSLALYWLKQLDTFQITKRQFDDALDQLVSMVARYEI